jgi:hypothetical protein
MVGRAATPQGRKLNNINNMPDRRYLPSIDFFVPFARLNSLLIGLSSKSLKVKKKINDIFFFIILKYSFFILI